MYAKQCLLACESGDASSLRDGIKAAQQSTGPAGLFATLSETSSDGRTLLQIAARRGHSECVNVLLAFGVQTNAVCVRDGKTALHCACEFGDHAMTIIESLLDERANPNAQDETGDTPLHILLSNVAAARHRVLLEQVLGRTTHPEIDISEEEQEELMGLAPQTDVTHRFEDIVEKMRERGADLTIQNNAAQMATDVCDDGVVLGRLARRYRLDTRGAKVQSGWKLTFGLNSTTVMPPSAGGGTLL